MTAFSSRFDGTDDYFDSREAQERIDQLVAEFDDALEDERGCDEANMSADDWAHMLNQDEAEELAALIQLRADVEQLSGDRWEDGITFLHDGHFEEYAEEFAYDIGAVDREANWPLDYIDWKAAAEALRVDYSSIDFRGGTYWVRS